MQRNLREMLKSLLIVISGIWLVVGILAAIVLLAFVRPKLSSEADRLDHAATASAPWDALSSGARVAALLPGTLDEVSRTLLDTSKTLVSTSRTAQKAKKGVTGLVLPKEKLTETQINMQRTSRQLKLLAGRIAELARASRPLGRLRSSAGHLADNGRSSIRSAQHILRQASLWVTLLGIAIFGICATVAAFSLALALLHARLKESAAISHREPPVRIRAA